MITPHNGERVHSFDNFSARMRGLLLAIAPLFTEAAGRIANGDDGGVFNDPFHGNRVDAFLDDIGSAYDGDVMLSAYLLLND